MNTALKSTPKSYPILLQQVDFLLSKGKADWACQVAQQAVNSAPSEFLTWAKLSETHIELGQFDKALLTLNSCPMFTFNERDLHRMPPPARTHLPVKKFIAESGLIDEESARDNEADVALLRLPAPGLRGTFAKAYELLAKMVSQIGWDELLKTRSAVFVMEEEYRQHKSTASIDAGHLNRANGEDDDNASTLALHSRDSDDGISRATTPTITVSNHDEEANGDGAKDTKDAADGDVDDEESKKTKHTSDSNGSEDAQDTESAKDTMVPLPELEKPEQMAHASEEAKDEGKEGFEGSAFSNKRLCERWLGELTLCTGPD